MTNYLLKNCTIINENKTIKGDILIKNNLIEKIGNNLSSDEAVVIDCEKKIVIPGIIDDQVHFREPGLTHKADILSESRAAVAGGTTSFMEMPNTNPTTTSLERLEEKFAIASKTSLANYSFFMGVSNDNAEEALKIDPKTVCGLKIFMGSSTGNMLVEHHPTLEKIFANSPTLIAIHSENDHIVKANLKKYQSIFPEGILPQFHHEVRDIEACYKMTEFAVDLAQKTNARLHVLHISTKQELGFFTNAIPIKNKRITSEVCVHHLWFDSNYYFTLGNLIKCNPAIKTPDHKEALLQALKNDTIDIIATDHAPHTWEEKQQPYEKAPSGLPLVQHSLNMMLDFVKQDKISIDKVVEKMCHHPAELFQVEKRGYIREGYFADLAVVDLNSDWEVSKNNILYKCGWSPLEGKRFNSKVTHTFVSGHLAYENGKFNNEKMGERLIFKR